MSCPILSTALAVYEASLEEWLPFSVEKDQFKDLSQRLTKDEPSVDTQRLRAFYAVDFMASSLDIGSSKGVPGSESCMLREHLRALNWQMSYEGLTEVVEALDKLRRVTLVDTAYRALEKAAARAALDAASSRLLARVDATSSAALLLRASLRSDVPRRLGEYLGNYIALIRMPTIIAPVLETLLAVTANGPLPTKTWKTPTSSPT
jgi:hypothetical protein